MKYLNLLRDKHLSRNAKLIYIYITQLTKKRLRIRPDKKLICKNLSISPNEYNLAMAQLERNKYISVAKLKLVKGDR